MNLSSHLRSTHPTDSSSREQPNSLPNNQGQLNFVDGAEAERIEERRAEDTPAPGRAAEDSLVVADIPAVGIPLAGIPLAGIPAVDIPPFRTPPADNLAAAELRPAVAAGCNNSL